MRYYYYKEFKKEIINPKILYVLNFDGSARPDYAGIGVIITDPIKNVII